MANIKNTPSIRNKTDKDTNRLVMSLNLSFAINSETFLIIAGLNNDSGRIIIVDNEKRETRIP